MGTAAIVGGRGKTGRAVAAAVHRLGGSARLIGRSELQHPAAALEGCESVYLITANMHPDEPGFVTGVLSAAEAAGVTRVVYHSVVAPHLPEMPHHIAKAESERLVRNSGLEWTILQPGVYMQNFVPQLLAAAPSLTVPYDPRMRFTLVDLADVAQVAATVLGDPGFLGATLEVGGPQHVSIDDVARAASELLARQVPVRRITTREWTLGPGADLSARERDWLIAMFDYYDAHGLLCGATPAEAVLGRRPAALAETLRREFTHTAIG